MSVELALPHSRSEKKNEYKMIIELALLQFRTPAVEKNEYEMSEELALPQSCTPAVEKKMK